MTTTTKNIKDYLHLYYGCEVARYDSEGVRYKVAVNKAWLIEAFEKGGKNFYTYKLLLRPLSDMTEGEKDEYYKHRGFGWIYNLEKQMSKDAAGTRFLLSKSFDIFGLIESGLAIDKTKIPA